MPEHTPEQFAAAVKAAISSVVHLYRELDNLMRQLRDELSEPPDPLALVPGTLGKGGREGRQVIRYEYGALFRAGLGDEEELEEEGEDEDGDEDAEEDEGVPEKQMRGKEEIESDQAMVAVRVALYDARKQGIEPHLIYAVMNDWSVGSQGPGSGTTFVLARHMLRRIPRALAQPDPQQGSRLRTLAKVYSVAGVRRMKRKGGGDVLLTCRLPMGVQVVPLYALDAPGEIAALAGRIKTMWADAAKPGNSGP